jgi:ubiquinone/menaquinone biosynthesis C-methylase UbiE
MCDHGSATAQQDVLPVLQSKEETKAFYNKIAKVYDLLAERTEQPIRNASFEKLAAKPGERILEIGFGTGHNLARIARAVGTGGRVYGIDLAENMVAATHRTLEKAGLVDIADLRCGDAEQLPYQAESMDAVIMNFTLELFDTPDIALVLDEVYRVLRQEGRIVVAGISKEGKRDFVVHAFEWTHRHFPNLMDCRPIFISRALGDAGFLVVDVKLDHMWVPVEIAVGVKP